MRIAEQVGDVRPRLTKEQVALLPLVKYVPEDESKEPSTSAALPSSGRGAACTVCLVDFDDGEQLRVLPCGHHYHPPCILSWLTNVSSTVDEFAGSLTIVGEKQLSRVSQRCQGAH